MSQGNLHAISGEFYISIVCARWDAWPLL